MEINGLSGFQGFFLGKNSMEAPCAVWDFTLFDSLDDAEKVKEWLGGIAKNWVFQLEKGEVGGKLHFQGRLSLWKKSREGWWKLGCPWKAHFSPTADPNQRKGVGFYEGYAGKETTRVSGPWNDKDYLAVREMPDQMKVFMDPKNWYPWQVRVGLECNRPSDARAINLIIAAGNTGKSSFALYLNRMKWAKYVPTTIETCEKLMGFVFSFDIKKCYVFDIPRAQQVNRGLWAAIETIKSGYAYDTRYHGKEIEFSSPAVWIFTNGAPDFTMLSIDRYRCWNIHPETKDLVPWCG